MQKRSRKEAAAAVAEGGKPKLNARSDNHVCFKGVRLVGTNRSEYERVPQGEETEDDLRPNDHEFFVGPSGTTLYRAELSAPVTRRKLWGEEKHGEVLAREPAQIIWSGLTLIEDFCQEMRVPMPGVCRDRKNDRDARNAAASKTKREGRAGGPRQPAEGGGKAMKSKNGKTMGAEWSDRFAENEAAAKNGKALTDEQLKDAMYKAFPEAKKGVTTIERVSMQRSCYNAGTAQFKSFGPAGTPKRPKSSRYEDGRTPTSGRKKADKPAKKERPKKGGKA